MQISFKSVLIFVTIRGKRNWETAKIGIRTPLKLYVYFQFLINNRHLADHISEPYAKFCGNSKELRT